MSTGMQQARGFAATVILFARHPDALDARTARPIQGLSLAAGLVMQQQKAGGAILIIRHGGYILQAAEQERPL